jgi:hypothetical protein
MHKQCYVLLNTITKHIEIQRDLALVSNNKFLQISWLHYL